MVPFVWEKCEWMYLPVGCVGLTGGTSRPKESIETMKGMASPAAPRYDDKSVCSTMWGGRRGWVK